MTKLAGWTIVLVTVCFISCGCLHAAESRTPSPEEVREVIRRYNESGKISVPQRQQPPKGAVEFNRAITLHTKKNATPAELKEAASLYQAALDAGLSQAATNLALLYLEGKGVKKDTKKALSLLNNASAKNDSQADIALARLYLIGTDVKKDEKKGEVLLNKAAKAGNQNAVKMLAEYRDWKKKNEQAMKQYQELMKQVQSAQNKPASIQPLQVFPQPSATARAGIPFPVIPGYSYVAGNPVVMPDFIPPPQRAVVTIPPQGASAVPQPITVFPQGNELRPLNMEMKQPAGQMDAPRAATPNQTEQVLPK